MVSPCPNHLKKLAAMAAAVQAKGKKFYMDSGGTESDEDDLCDSEDTSSNSGSD